MLRTFTLIKGDTHYGPHVWDDVAGTIQGTRAAEIEFYWDTPWYYTPLSFGDAATPAKHSNDGLCALLEMLGYTVDGLAVERVAEDSDIPGVLN